MSGYIGCGAELSEDWIHYERYIVAVNIGKFELWAAIVATNRKFKRL